MVARVAAARVAVMVFAATVSAAWLAGLAGWVSRRAAVAARCGFGGAMAMAAVGAAATAAMTAAAVEEADMASTSSRTTKETSISKSMVRTRKLLHITRKRLMKVEDALDEAAAGPQLRWCAARHVHRGHEQPVALRARPHRRAAAQKSAICKKGGWRLWRTKMWFVSCSCSSRTRWSKMRRVALAGRRRSARSDGVAPVSPTGSARRAGPIVVNIIVRGLT